MFRLFKKPLSPWPFLLNICWKNFRPLWGHLLGHYAFCSFFWKIVWPPLLNIFQNHCKISILGHPLSNHEAIAMISMLFTFMPALMHFSYLQLMQFLVSSVTTQLLPPERHLTKKIIVWKILGAVHNWRHHFWGISRPPLPLVIMSSFGHPPPPLSA